jgi:tetratricopeptide (TPR) repeat protein
MKLFFAVFVPLFAIAAPPAHKPVIALMPPNSTAPELIKLGLLMEARASEILEVAGKTHEIHLRQVLAMAKSESIPQETLSLPPMAEPARQALGADKVITTVLKRTKTKVQLNGFIVESGKKTAFSAWLPQDWPSALVAGSEAIAKALLGAKIPTTAIQPQSTSEAALVALSDCWDVALRQPLGIEEPVVIRTSELNLAIAACQKAFELDGSLHFALSTKALLQAIAGDDKGAVRSLNALDTTDDAFESFTLARFWLITRYQSNEAGVAFLQDAAQKHSGELILLSTLAQDYASLHDQAKAIEVWEKLLEAAPNSPIALGHLSQAEAKSGHLAEALTYAKRALSLAPMSKEAKFQLASRNIDMGKPQEAIGPLSSLVTENTSRAEYVLQLGWAHWLNGDIEKAQSLFTETLKRATSIEEWRTRGRAHYLLALVDAKRGNADGAQKQMVASRETGFRVRNVDAALVALLKNEKFKAEKEDAGNAVVLVPRESSLFPIDFFGELEPTREKPAPPDGFILFRF